jgi:hypothetical protein
MEEKGFIVALSLTDIVPMASIDEVKIYDLTGGNTVLLNGKTVMQYNEPVVEWPVKVSKVEEWATTIEELAAGTPSWHHRKHLKEMLFELQCMLRYHKQQHETVVTEAPTIEDLSAYLSYYAASRHV